MEDVIRRPALDPVTRAMIQVGVVLLVIAALHLTASVTVPLAFAVFLMGLFWPMYVAIERVAPAWVGALAVLIAFLLVVAVLGGALGLAGARVMQAAPEYEQQWAAHVEDLRAWLSARGLPAPKGGDLPLTSLGKGLSDAAGSVFDATGGFVLVIGFLLLGLVEVHDFRAKLSDHGDDERAAAIVRDVAYDFRQYVWVRTGLGLVTGLMVWGATALMGLDLAFVWGLSTFLLNYIPTLGSVLAVVPPILLALAQGGWGFAAGVAAVVGAIQIVMGTWVGPLLQGRYLSLSALVVLLSVAFWGLVWGIPGAFVGVPITTVIVLVARRYERTRWIADLLSRRWEDQAETSS